MITTPGRPHEAPLTILFLSGYAAAQLKAGSTALAGLFGWHEATGIVLGAVVVVVVYCFAGGLRASIWTDAAQALVMICALAALLLCAAWRVGGPGVLFSALDAADPRLVQWLPNGLRFGLAPYLLGFVFRWPGSERPTRLRSTGLWHLVALSPTEWNARAAQRRTTHRSAQIHGDVVNYHQAHRCCSGQRR